MINFINAPHIETQENTIGMRVVFLKTVSRVGPNGRFSDVTTSDEIAAVDVETKQCGESAKKEWRGGAIRVHVCDKLVSKAFFSEWQLGGAKPCIDERVGANDNADCLLKRASVAFAVR